MIELAGVKMEFVNPAASVAAPDLLVALAGLGLQRPASLPNPRGLTRLLQHLYLTNRVMLRLTNPVSSVVRMAGNWALFPPILTIPAGTELGNTFGHRRGAGLPQQESVQ